jgi:hypothetical protein
VAWPQNRTPSPARVELFDQRQYNEYQPRLLGRDDFHNWLNDLPADDFDQHQDENDLNNPGRREAFKSNEYQSHSGRDDFQNWSNDDPTVDDVSRAYTELTTRKHPSLFLKMIRLGKAANKPKGWISSKLFLNGASVNFFLTAKLWEIVSSADAILLGAKDEVYDVDLMAHAFDQKKAK